MYLLVSCNHLFLYISILISLSSCHKFHRFTYKISALILQKTNVNYLSCRCLRISFLFLCDVAVVAAWFVNYMCFNVKYNLVFCQIVDCQIRPFHSHTS